MSRLQLAKLNVTFCNSQTICFFYHLRQFKDEQVLFIIPRKPKGFLFLSALLILTFYLKNLEQSFSCNLTNIEIYFLNITHKGHVFFFKSDQVAMAIIQAPYRDNHCATHPFSLLLTMPHKQLLPSGFRFPCIQLNTHIYRTNFFFTDLHDMLVLLHFTVFIISFVIRWCYPVESCS